MLQGQVSFNCTSQPGLRNKVKFHSILKVLNQNEFAVASQKGEVTLTFSAGKQVRCAVNTKEITRLVLIRFFFFFF